MFIVEEKKKKSSEKDHSDSKSKVDYSKFICVCFVFFLWIYIVHHFCSHIGFGCVQHRSRISLASRSRSFTRCLASRSLLWLPRSFFDHNLSIRCSLPGLPWRVPSCIPSSIPGRISSRILSQCTWSNHRLPRGSSTTWPQWVRFTLPTIAIVNCIIFNNCLIPSIVIIPQKICCSQQRISARWYVFLFSWVKMIFQFSNNVIQCYCSPINRPCIKCFFEQLGPCTRYHLVNLNGTCNKYSLQMIFLIAILLDHRW